MAAGNDTDAEGLTHDDWAEIYHALARKAEDIEAGHLDDELGEVERSGSETARWAAHLRRIMARIASSGRGAFLR
jgi:hypothetical protein